MQDQRIALLNTVFIIVFIIAGVSGYKKGLIRSLIPVISFLLSLIFFVPVSNIAEPIITPYISATVKPATEIIIEIPQNELNLSNNMKDSPLKSFIELVEEKTSEILQLTTDQLTKKLIRIIVLILTSAIMSTLLYYGLGQLRSVERIPIISTLNRFGGCAISLIWKVVEVNIVFIIIYYIAMINPEVKQIYEYMLEVPLISLIVKYNFLVLLY